ncbi:MAG: putative Ig domain-containing protein [Melioribacter sp.]|nr:putative Ig domain-containing protein [Melioribacter sp.]
MKNKIFLIIIAMLVFCGLSFAQVTITLPTATGQAGSESLFPITVSNLTGQNVTSFQFQINYNKSVIYITAISVSGTMLGANVPTTRIDTAAGYIRVAWASDSPLTGAGTLLNIRIRFRGSGTTPLEFGDIVYAPGNVNPKMFGPPGLQVNWVNGSATVSTTNNPPVFTPVSNQSVNEGQTLTFTVSATDPENDPLTYSAVNLPSGASFNPTTRTFTWTPNYNQQGNYVLVFRVSDGVNIVSLNVNVTVVNVNRPPVLNLNTTSPVNISEGQNYRLKLTATDPDSGATLLFYGTNLPAGAFVTADGWFIWTPNYTQAGSYIVTFTVRDEYNATDSKTLVINVANANQPPVFTKKIPKDTVVIVHNVPVPFTFQYRASDAEGDPLIFAQVEIPANASITSSGLFTWTPTIDQANKTFRIIVAVFDGHNIVNDTTTVRTSPVVSVSDKSLIPSNFELYQNYPNPFNPTTTISFAIPKESFVRLKIINTKGEEVATIVNRVMPAGYHSFVFNAANLTSGIYFYRLEADNYIISKKMILMK